MLIPDPSVNKLSSVIGEIRLANLTLLEFQAQAGIGWVACDGGSVAGSTYAAKTGKTSAPLQANSFIRIN